MSLGYMGFVKLYRDVGTKGGSPSNPVLLLTTGGGINMVLEPLYSNAVYGTGWYNAPETAHYADAAIRFEGSVSVDWQANADIWGALRDWGVEQRAYARSIDVSPNGNDVYQYHATGTVTDTSGTVSQVFDNKGAFCTSMSMNTSAGNLVSGDIGIVALTRTVDPTNRKPYIQQRTGVTTCAELATTHPLNPGGRNTDPIPFWKTDAMLYKLDSTGIASYEEFSSVGCSAIQEGIKVMEWNVERNNNHQIIYTCGGDREAQYVLMGAISATGSVTMFHPEGVMDPVLGPDPTSGAYNPMNPYLYAENTVFRVKIAGRTSTDAATNYFVEMPAVVIEGEDFGMKGPNDVVTRQFNLKGLGGRCNKNGVLLPPHLLSDPNVIYNNTGDRIGGKEPTPINGIRNSELKPAEGSTFNFTKASAHSGSGSKDKN